MLALSNLFAKRARLDIPDIFCIYVDVERELRVSNGYATRVNDLYVERKNPYIEPAVSIFFIRETVLYEGYKFRRR